MLSLPFTIKAQVSHEISLNGGGGLSIFNYKLSKSGNAMGAGGDVGAGYTCLFNKFVGIRIGAEVGFYNAKAKLDGLKVVTPSRMDSENDRFIMHTILSKYTETVNSVFVNIPLMLQIQAGETQKFYALIGAKAGIPISNKCKVSDATLTNEAYYPEYDNWLKEQEFAGFGTFTGQKVNGKFKLGITAILAVEIGGKWKLGEKLALYTGAFFDYGVNNSGKKEPFVNYKAENPASFTTNSAMAANKMNIMAAGIKLRFAFIPKSNQIINNEKVVTNEKPKTSVAEKQKTEKVEKNKKTKTEKRHEPSTVDAPVEVIVLPIEVELTLAVEFTLGRPAHSGFPAAATGISWVSNIDANTAKFTTASNKLVNLSDIETYNTITTQEKLKEIYDAGNKTSEFTAKGGANFKPHYLIIQDGEILRLIEMTSLTFKAGESKAYFKERH
jgi:hypothetical protein